MKLNPIAENMTEIELGVGLDGKPNRVLFSYSTPVAVYRSGEGYYRTNKFWSRTTSRHINKWLKMNGADDPSAGVKTLTQSFLDTFMALINEK
jgi:hypothetical protein